ncbi:hypothetical protein B9479_007528, partial [Cryptococcus floricola]
MPSTASTSLLHPHRTPLQNMEHADMDDASLDGPASLERALAAWAEDDQQLQDAPMRSSPVQAAAEEDEGQDQEDEGSPSPADFREFQDDGNEEELSCELRSGMEFDNADSAKVAIITHSLAQSGASAKGQSNAERIRYECGSAVDNGGASAACGYHVTITYRKNDNKWVVANKKRSKQNLVHTCTPLAGERLSHSRQIFVEAMLRQHCTVTRTSPAKDLQKALKDKLNCEVPLQAIYSAKLAITDGDVDRQSAAFRQLPALVEKRGQSGVAPTQNSQLRVEGGMSQPGVVRKRGRPKTSKKRKQPDGTLAP